MSVGGRWKSATRFLCCNSLAAYPVGWSWLIRASMPAYCVNASKRLVEGSAEHLLFDTLLDRCKQRGWLKARERQRTDSMHV